MKYRRREYFNKMDEYHRTDGPALINGFKIWFQNGKYHRLDGPAYIGSSGTGGTKEWYINDIFYGYGKEPPEDYLKELEKLGIKFDRGSDD